MNSEFIKFYYHNNNEYRLLYKKRNSHSCYRYLTCLHIVIYELNKVILVNYCTEKSIENLLQNITDLFKNQMNIVRGIAPFLSLKTHKKMFILGAEFDVKILFLNKKSTKPLIDFENKKVTFFLPKSIENKLKTQNKQVIEIMANYLELIIKNMHESIEEKIARKIPYLIKSLNGAYGKYIHSLQDIEAFANKDDFKNIIYYTKYLFFYPEAKIKHTIEHEFTHFITWEQNHISGHGPAFRNVLSNLCSDFKGHEKVKKLYYGWFIEEY